MLFGNHNVVKMQEVPQCMWNRGAHTLLGGWASGRVSVGWEPMRLRGREAWVSGPPGEPFRGLHLQIPHWFLLLKANMRTHPQSSRFAHEKRKNSYCEIWPDHSPEHVSILRGKLLDQTLWPKGRDGSQCSPPGLLSHPREENNKLMNHFWGSQPRDSGPLKDWNAIVGKLLETLEDNRQKHIHKDTGGNEPLANLQLQQTLTSTAQELVNIKP